MVEPPTLGQVYVGETAVDVGSTPTPVTMTSNRRCSEQAKRYYSKCGQTLNVGDVRSAQRTLMGT